MRSFPVHPKRCPETVTERRTVASHNAISTRRHLAKVTRPLYIISPACLLTYRLHLFIDASSRCVRWSLVATYYALFSDIWLVAKPIITLLSSPRASIRTEPSTVIQQYGDSYANRWWVGCYILYSAQSQSPPHCTKCNSPPINASIVPTSYYLMWHDDYLSPLKG